MVVLLSTHTDGVAPPSCAHFPSLLEDHVHDFRVSQDALSHLRFAVVGFGSDVYRGPPVNLEPVGLTWRN